MRLTFINTILCLFIVVMGIALSTSSSVENDDNLAMNMDWNDFENFYPAHFLNARAAKSRFWKRAPRRHFWKRSLDQSAMANDMIDSTQRQN